MRQESASRLRSRPPHDVNQTQQPLTQRRSDNASEQSTANDTRRGPRHSNPQAEPQPAGEVQVPRPTGRNAHAKSLFNAHAAMRSFMVFPPDVIGVYLDWRTQEVGVVAALSGDQALMDDYRTGDIYHALAKLCGLTADDNVKRWKAENPAVRQRMKALQLAILYGMSVPSLAKGLNRHPLIASDIIERHKRRYPRFWQWRAEQTRAAMLDRRMTTQFEWPLYISNSPNERTLYNFPAQGNGAEMLRLAAVRLCEAGLVPSMLIHDGRHRRRQALRSSRRTAHRGQHRAGFTSSNEEAAA